MAQYDMTEEVKRIAELTGVTANEIADELGIEYETERYDFKARKTVEITNPEYIAWNRREESAVLDKLKEVEEMIEKEANRSKAKENFHWVKEEDDWVVAGDFSDVEIGDTIEVFKVNGTSQFKKVTRFSNQGGAHVE